MDLVAAAKARQIKYHGRERFDFEGIFTRPWFTRFECIIVIRLTPQYDLKRPQEAPRRLASKIHSIPTKTSKDPRPKNTSKKLKRPQPKHL